MQWLGYAWYESWRSLIHYLGSPSGDPSGWLARANALAACRDIRTGEGLPARFVEAGSVEPISAQAHRNKVYELAIAESGEIPTRTSGHAAWHDYFNALVWLAMPLSKATINRRQAQAIRSLGISGQRGALRDALTVFDESAVLFVTDKPAAVEELRGHSWRALLVDGRRRFDADIRCVIVGHALLQKLMQPYKAICGQALVLPECAHAPGQSDHSDATDTVLSALQSCATRVSVLDMVADIESRFCRLDEQAARQLASAEFGKPSLTPLPVLGVPGWWQPNCQPEFYNDPTVFRARAGRTRPNDPRETRA